ncbi:hypothetical protein F2Q70_00020952 [Brassica cretica]|uniref:Uncharacterized protein n=1 Tax=Brassica cretica TaxID=69181 RepID=A0A8S9GWV5_BRACR|nr:hypothetical protein F2Q70_00020952 [Brassica cretica]
MDFSVQDCGIPPKLALALKIWICGRFQICWNFLADGCSKVGGVSSLIVFISMTKKMNTLVSTRQNLTVTVGAL